MRIHVYAMGKKCLSHVDLSVVIEIILSHATQIPHTMRRMPNVAAQSHDEAFD